MSIDSVASGAGQIGLTAHRPLITGTRHVVSAGHPLAAQAAFQILEAGGNAADAGVAAGLALGVVHSEMVNLAGVAPIIYRTGGSDEVCVISGLGCWPRNIPADLFQRGHDGAIPEGILRTVVPSAPTLGFRRSRASARCVLAMSRRAPFGSRRKVS